MISGPFALKQIQAGCFVCGLADAARIDADVAQQVVGEPAELGRQVMGIPRLEGVEQTP